MLIFGHNEDLSPELSDVLRESGASRCILLPGVPEAVRQSVSGEAVTVVQVDDAQPVYRLPEPPTAQSP